MARYRRMKKDLVRYIAVLDGFFLRSMRMV